MNLGVQLRVYRKSKGHSVKKVAELTGIPVDRIYKWEKGTRPSDAEDLLKIRAYMGGRPENPPKNENGNLETKPEVLPGHATLQDLLNEKERVIKEIETSRDKVESLLAEAHKEKMALIETLKISQRLQEKQLAAMESNLAKGQASIENLLHQSNNYWNEVLLVNPGLLMREPKGDPEKKDTSVSMEREGSENKDKGR